MYFSAAGNICRYHILSDPYDMTNQSSGSLTADRRAEFARSYAGAGDFDADLEAWAANVQF